MTEDRYELERDEFYRRHKDAHEIVMKKYGDNPYAAIYYFRPTVGFKERLLKEKKQP